MNAAHIHLLLNHLPLIAIPMSLLFIAHSLWAKNASSKKFAYLVLFFSAALVIPVFLTGEPAEKVVEHLPGVTESFIEPHEDAGQISLILTLIAGIAALLALVLPSNEKRAKILTSIVIATSLLAILSLAYTANLGGKIRHTELRNESSVSESGPTE